jgi:hypothetical protein
MLLACAVLVLGAAGRAYAHTAQILIQSSTLIYQQFPGISVDRNNDVTISESVDSSGPYYVVDDPESTGMFFPAQCTPLLVEQTSVRCPASGITALYVRTGNASKAEPTRSSSITITAPTPATLSGGSASVNAGTSNVTAGPVGGNVLYGSLGGGTLNAKNGFIDFIHTCPPANTVEADLNDILIPDCAAIPEPPGTPPPSSPLSPSTSTPGSPSFSPSGSGSPGLSLPSGSSAAPSAVVAVTFHQPQAVLRRRFLLLTVSVAMALTVRVHGSIALPGAARSLALSGTAERLGAPGATATLRLRLPKRTLVPLRHAFARHTRLYVNVQIDAANPSSSSSFSLARRVRIVP